MKTISFIGILTFLMTWAFALAAPPATEYSPNLASVFSRDTQHAQFGINCRGSSKCVGSSDKGCHNIKDLQSLIHQLDDDKWFKEGAQIACTDCRNNIGGVCAFTQKRNGRDIPGWRIKELINDLVRHGCHICGSIPTEPTGNDVNDGELTVNYVLSGCGNGVCADGSSVSTEDLNQELVNEEDVGDPVPAMSSRHILHTRTGINCRGSSGCQGSGPNRCNSIRQIQTYVHSLPDTILYRDGDKIACTKCRASGNKGICAFTENRKGVAIAGYRIKQLVDGLIAHGCTICGSNPTQYTGNNVGDGTLTVNYVTNICNEGVCGGGSNMVSVNKTLVDPENSSELERFYAAPKDLDQPLEDPPK